MKKHGQVEREIRIDSFEAEYRAFQIAPCALLPFEREGMRIRLDGEKIVKLAYMHNAAGRLTFFLCPCCGKRVRFLYLPEYRCRECSGLNYRCQQTTKGSLADIRAIPAKIGARQPGELELDYKLERPRYMHRGRFERHKKRLEKKLFLYISKSKKMIYSALRSAEEDTGGIYE